MHRDYSIKVNTSALYAKGGQKVEAAIQGFLMG
jgi:hypothetical protein